MNEAMEGYQFEGDIEAHRSKLMARYHQFEHFLPAVESFTILQALLQPVAEALLLIDRVTFLRERGIVDANLLKIFDDQLSPRCFVTLAWKGV